MTNDYLSNNTDIKYDHRNLITEIIKVDNLIDPPATYTTTYKYDEAGNRTQKTVLKNDGTIQETIVNEFYVRDAQGKEIAIYQGYELDFWNVWGMGNEGRIKSIGTNYFYLKDHLGSIRAVLNQSNYLVQALDYDSWGFLARSWDTTATRYKFTGKERDNESTYDYFGARYYNSRISVWLSTDPLFEKYKMFSPYSYVLVNPIIFIDPNGKWKARYDEESGKIYVTAEENDKFEDLYSQLGMTKDEFFEKYKDYISNSENFELNIGFELDITEQITGNAKFSNELTNVNCFSSCFAVLLGEEPVVLNKPSLGKGFSQDLSNSFGFKSEYEVKTGYLKTFEDENQVTHHATIYIIRSQKGIEYFFGRSGPNSKLSIQTSDILNQLYPDFKTYIFSYPKIK